MLKINLAPWWIFFACSQLCKGGDGVGMNLVVGSSHKLHGYISFLSQVARLPYMLQ